MADIKDSTQSARNAYKRNWAKAHPESCAEATRNWKKAHPELRAFHSQRRHAKSRKIAFLLTFEEWWSIWQMSGKWKQRGRHRGEYVMARFKDRGPYTAANVRICSQEENRAEYFENISDETRRRISIAHKGLPRSEEARRKSSEAAKAYIERHPGRMSEVIRARWDRRRTE